jgi:hypothetical protein
MYETKTLDISKIKIKDSKFFFCQPFEWDNDNRNFRIMEQSLLNENIISPVLVSLKNNNKFHLVDGFLRVLWAKKNNYKTIKCQILPSSVTTIDIVNIILLKYAAKINSNASDKARFINYCIDLGLSKSQIMKSFFHYFELENNHKIWQFCMDIGNLPENILDFCKEKKFSFKHCAYLSRFPKELLKYLLDNKNCLNLTASIFLELAQNTHDYLRREAISIDEFSRNSELSNTLNSDKNVHEKTLLFRNIISNKCFPILIKTNKKIEAIKTEMDIPKTVNIKWDRTLEEKEVSIDIKLKASDDLQKTLKIFSQTDFSDGIDRILEKL